MVLKMIGLSVVTAIIIWQFTHHSSPLVKGWRRSSFSRRSAGPLSVLDSGAPRYDTEEVVILLHGMGATGDYFGDTYDGLSRKRRVVIVDLLGFGESLDEKRTNFGVDAHTDALDQALDALGLREADVVLAAHSMSAAVALTWARRHPSRVRQVYLWGPPIYPDASAAEGVAAKYGLMGRLFVLDTKWARRMCRFNCAQRTLSGALMALVAPRWPTAVSSRASRHTWDAYEGSLRSLMLDFDWPSVLPAAVPLTIFRGENDPIGDPEYLSGLAVGSVVVNVPRADHHVALRHPELLFDSIDNT